MLRTCGKGTHVYECPFHFTTSLRSLAGPNTLLTGFEMAFDLHGCSFCAFPTTENNHCYGIQDRVAMHTATYLLQNSLPALLHYNPTPQLLGPALILGFTFTR